MTIARFIAAAATLAFAVGAHGQAATATSAPATTSKPLSTSLGLVVFPAKNQNASKQAADEGECFAWAKGQTGVDPMALNTKATATTAPTTTTSTTADGSRAKGAVRGAAAGAVIGGIASDDAGKGAAIGATAGVIKGGADSRRNRNQAAQKAEADAAKQAEQQKAAAAEQLAFFNKGFAACLESRGYTVK